MVTGTLMMAEVKTKGQMGPLHIYIPSHLRSSSLHPPQKKNKSETRVVTNPKYKASKCPHLRPRLPYWTPGRDSEAYLVASSGSARLCPGASGRVVAIATCAFSRPGGLGRGAPAPSPGNRRLGRLRAKRRVQGRRYVHRDIASPGPVVAAVRRAVTGAVARAPQGRHGLRCREALPAPHGRPIAQALAGDSHWRAATGDRTATANPEPVPPLARRTRSGHGPDRSTRTSGQDGEARDGACPA